MHRFYGNEQAEVVEFIVLSTAHGHSRTTGRNWLEMGMRGRRSWDKMEERLGVNGGQLFVPIGCNLEE